MGYHGFRKCYSSETTLQKLFSALNQSRETNFN